ncbi:MAG: putative RNA helicase [Promethearchaeota archaeon]|nr:MAG: putative RNA helicase [Candidatus Lokiarchaeota archaeon]
MMSGTKANLSTNEQLSKNPYLKLDKIELREYQLKLASKSSLKNSLIVLPTGLGKTIIALLITAKSLSVYPPTSKILFLAPTRPLINQHFQTFQNLLEFPEEEMVILTGKTTPSKRKELFIENRILFYTPQTLRNDIIMGRYDLKDVCLIIFDEAHHAFGDYAYTTIADEYIAQNQGSIILALTASPGHSKERINELCTNLHIPLENIHIRTRGDKDVEDYIQSMEIEKIGTSLNPLMIDVRKHIYSILEERLQFLAQLGFLKVKTDLLHEKIIRKDLLRLKGELIGILQTQGDKSDVYSAISINAQALILYHIVLLIEQQGLNTLLIYLEKLLKEAKKYNSSKAVRSLGNEYRIKKLFLKLRQIQDKDPKLLEHPKYELLRETILEELNFNDAARILVFVKLRASVKNLVSKLKKLGPIRPVRFVGQSNVSKKDKGLSQKQQIEILKDFKDGSYNVLVSTNIGEEGLDISECDLVVFYDIVTSEIRLIQRKGRTARHREGKVVMLYCKDTQDEMYLRIAESKLRKMNKNLKNKGTLRKFIKSTRKPKKEPNINPKKPNRKIPPKDQQSKLMKFTKLKSKQKETSQRDSYVIIGTSLSMKYGIRKKLQKKGIEFETKDWNYHIIINQKVLLQIFSGNKVNTKKLLRFKANEEKNFDLIIIICDFIEYKEGIEGEKRIIKRDLKQFGEENKIKIIPIDIPEEFYFILENIIAKIDG